TVSESGHRVAARRWRRSWIASSGTLNWKGRISESPGAAADKLCGPLRDASAVETDWASIAVESKKRAPTATRLTMFACIIGAPLELKTYPDPYECMQHATDPL